MSFALFSARSIAAGVAARVCFRLVVCIGISLSFCIPAAFAADPGDNKTSPTDLPARVTMEQHGWGPDGELVLAIHVHASSNKPLELGKLSKNEEEEPVIFTLQASYLMDIKTSTRLNPLSKRLKKPYFGPVSAISSLPAKGWIQLSVTFPTPPDPGKDAKGNPLPYQLRFFPPMGLSPVDISIPQRVATVQKAGNP